MADELYNEVKKDEDVFNLDNKFKTAQSYIDTGGGLRSSSNKVAPTIQVFTSSGTWTKPIGLKYAVVETQGSGGNGTTHTEGGGGGGGAYSKKNIPSSDIGATEIVTVGAAGAGGGNTSFGSLLVSPNGANAAGSVGGAGGVASGGDVNISGQNGRSSSTANEGNAGGGSMLGNGGAGGGKETVQNQNSSGSAGGGYGGGGGGGGGYLQSGLGGDGTAGIVIVTEYY